MSLIKCPECGGTVSDKAPMCPHCGYLTIANRDGTTQEYVRCFRRREMDFEPVLKMTLSGDKVGAKRQIEQLLSGLTKVNVGYGLLKIIEAQQGIPSNEEIANYITQKEIVEAQRKIATSSAKTKAKLDNNQSVAQTNKCIPKCPTCGSTSLDKITAFDRGVAAGVFGMISKTARSQFRCEKCGCMW